MTKEAQMDHWIAASQSEDTLTLWQMRGQQTHNTHVVSGLAPVDAAQLSAIASETGWDAAPIFACGLANNATPHVPTSVVDLPLQETSPPFAAVVAVSGIEQTQPRGQLGNAACQIAGFLSLNPNWDGVICVVDTRSHWVLVSANEVVSFESTLTPQLARTLGADHNCDLDLLKDALNDSLSRPEALAARLSSVTCASDLGEATAAQASARIWGGLLGAELAATRPYWLGQNLALIADPSHTVLYGAALDSQFLPVTVTNAQSMLLAGLADARRRFVAAASGEV